MQFKKIPIVVMCVVSLAVFLYGCGSSSREGSGTPADVAKVDESACASCHSVSASKVTGDPIYSDYIASAHFLVPNAKAGYPNGVGCQGCHGGGSQHNGVGPIPYTDPAASGKCFECHKNYLTKAHFRNMTASSGSVSSAIYASKNYENACTACHDPHKADKGITRYHTEWAESGHGEVSAAAWGDRDFKNTLSGGSYQCSRCHTSTGFISYVTNNYTDPFPKTTWAATGDKSREVLTCQACHTNYNFKYRVRSVRAFTAPYNSNKNPVSYDNVGASNLCVACHSGRESGDSVNALASYTNASFVNPHYMPAAAMLFSKSGYRYYSSASKYTSSNDHSKLGTASESASAATGSTSGPCVTCHIGVSGKNTHTFKAMAVASKTSSGGCYGCHSATIADEEESRAYFARFMDFFNWQLAQSGIYYSSAYPYFYANAAGTTQLKNWTTVGPAGGTGAKNMGAAFNYKFIAAEGGAHVHNRTFAKRLITDSIQYLQTGVNTYSYSASTSGPNVNGQTDPNNIIRFSAYSAARPAFSFTDPSSGVVTNVSIQTLKDQLLRNRSGLYYRR